MAKRKIVKTETPNDKDMMLCPVCKQHRVSYGFWRKYRKCVICYYDRHSSPVFFGDEELPESRKFFENAGRVYI